MPNYRLHPDFISSTLSTRYSSWYTVFAERNFCIPLSTTNGFMIEPEEIHPDDQLRHQMEFGDEPTYFAE